MSFKALLTTSHVTTFVSELFAVDFRKHLLPQNQRCSQPMSTGPPCASASSACAAVTGWGTASTASRWKIHPWGNDFYFGNPKSYLRHMWHDGKHSTNRTSRKKTDFDIKVKGTTGRTIVNQLQLQMLAPNEWWMVANVTAQSISCMLHIYSQHKSYHTISTYHILQIHPSTH